MALASDGKLGKMREQLAQLQTQIAEEEAKGRAEAIEQIRSIMDMYSITPEDLTKRRRGGSKGPVPPKYQDPATGATWSGRGREPGWIKGKKHERFLIQE